MLEDLEFFSRIIALFTGGYSLFFIIKDITRPNYVTPVFFVFLFFFWSPLVLDTFIGVADYSFKYNILNKVVNNDLVGLYYNCYVIYLIILFLFFSRRTVFKVNLKEINNLVFNIYKIRYYLYIICVLPVFLLLLVDNPLNYLFYRSLNSNYVIQTSEIDNLLMAVSVIACISGSILLFVENKFGALNTKYIRAIIICLLILLAIVVNGKRNVVPIFFIIYFSLLYFCGIKSVMKLFKFGIVSSLIVYVFISFYGKYSNVIGAENYARNRIDFGRLEVTKFVIYNDIVLNESILDYKGQSFLFSLFFYVPRNLWESKPQPYAVYMTKELLNMKSAEYLGWSMTTSIFEESISNFGFWLALFFPFIYFFILKKVVLLPDIFKILGFFMMIMLLVVQFSAISSLLIITFVCFLLFKFKKIITWKRC